jgi:DNA helicase-2/ATP-dependent DNA helicase PcrA
MADKVEAPDWVEAVNVMTIHQAKGLQFSTVFIPMLCEGRFPLEQQTRSWMLPSSVFDSSRYLGSMDDERRLFYVAATRAADRLYLTFAREVGTRRRRNPSVFYSACSSTPTMTSPTPSLPSNAKDSESPLSLSYSSMELYLSCPFRYRLAHEVRIATPENPFFEFGRILHYVARLMHELHASGERLTPGDIEKLYEDHFHIRLHVPEFTVIRRKAAGIRALKHYYATRRAWFDQMTAVEQAFDVVDTNTILRGQYDLLISDKGKTTIIDFKTGSPHDYINTKLQMMLYAWAAETALGLSVRNTIVFYMERDEEMSYTPTSSLTAGARTTFLKVAAAIKGRAFAPTPGRVCMRCEYRKVCPHREEGVRYD